MREFRERPVFAEFQGGEVVPRLGFANVRATTMGEPRTLNLADTYWPSQVPPVAVFHSSSIAEDKDILRAIISFFFKIFFS
jgi:hypothetical protein